MQHIIVFHFPLPCTTCDFTALGCSPSVEIWQRVLEFEDYFFFVYDFCWGHAAALFFFFNFLGLDVLTSCLAASKADGRQFSYFAFSKLFHISEDFGVQPRALNSRMGSGNSMLLLSSRQKEKTKYQSTKFSKSMT